MFGVIGAMASSMADPSFLDDLSDNFLQCPIHLDRFVKPKMLPCLHSVCLTCLDQWYQQMGGENQVTCPQCRKVCAVPPGGVQEFPDNFLMNSLLDFVAQTGGGEGDDIKRCDICEKESLNAEVMRCADCAMFLCIACTASHKKIPQTASHELISFEDFNKLSVADKLSLTSPLCPKHPSSRLEFYCAKCKIPVCTQCTVVAHRAPVHSIQELSEAFTKIQKQMKSEIKGSSKRYSKVQLAIADTSATLTELETQRDIAYEAAQQQADSINELVVQYLADIEEQIDQEYTDKKEALDDKLEGLLGIEEELKHTQEFGERVIQYGNQVTLASVGPEIISKLKGLVSTFQKKERVEVKANLSFQINEEFQSELCPDSIGFITSEDGNEENEEEEKEEGEDVQEDPPKKGQTNQSSMPIPSPENTLIERTYKGKTNPEKALQLQIRVRDACGNAIKEEEGTVWDCRMQNPYISQEIYEEFKKSGQQFSTASIDQHEDGSSYITFLAKVPGRFILYVTMNGKPIKSYPYTVQVYPPRESEVAAPGVAQLNQLVSNMANLQLQFQMTGGGRGTGFEARQHGGQRHRHATDDGSDNESVSSEKGGQGRRRRGSGGRGRGGERRGRGGSREGGRGGQSMGGERGGRDGKDASSERGGRGGRGKSKGEGENEGRREQGGGRGGGRGGKGGESTEPGGRGGAKVGKGSERGGNRGGRGGSRGGNRGRGGKGGKD